MRYRFGDCILDSEQRELQRTGHTIKLRRKAFDLLLCLASQAGQVLSKQALVEQVWPGRVISDATLVSSIKDVRQAINDADQSIIQTLHGHGYRFNAQISVQPGFSSCSTLPSAATSFVGREQELALLLQQLAQADCRLLTVIGPGGIGKTRLILQAAHGLTEALPASFADGVHWVDLSAIGSQDGLISTVAQSLGCYLSEADPAQQLLDYLTRKKRLLVLDNFEQLQAHATVLQSWLEAAADLKLLLSSRLPLPLAQEWRFPLSGLQTDNALALFHARAQRAQPDYDRQHPAISDICVLLDGLPLAIEMAASWLRLLTPDEILRQLAQNRDLLDVTEPSIAPRQANMQDVLTQSWRLLPTAERETLRKLSVFVGGFSLEAAQNVAAAMLAQLASLADKALLQRDPTGRYRLHELIRQYATERLRQYPEQTLTAQCRHSQYYLGLLAQHNPLQLRSEFGNIRSAWINAIAQRQWPLLEHSALALFNYCNIGGRYLQGMELFTLAQQAIPADQKALHGVCERRWMAFRSLLGEQSTAYDYFRARVDTPDLSLPERIFSRMQLGQLAVWQERHQDALPQLQAALQESQTSVDRLLQAQVSERLAQILVHVGQLGQGLTTAESSLALWRHTGQSEGIAQALDSLGFAHFCQGDFARAITCYQESLERFQDIADLNGQALALGGLGIITCMRQNPVGLAQLEQATVLARQTGHRLHLMTRLDLLAWGHNALGQYDHALPVAEECLGIAKTLGNIRYTIVAYHHGAEAALGLNDLSASRTYLRQALLLTPSINSIPILRLLLSCVHWLIRHAVQLPKPQQSLALQLAGQIQNTVHAHPNCWPITRLAAQQFMQGLTITLPKHLPKKSPAHDLYDLVQQCLATYWREERIDPVQKHSVSFLTSRQ